MKNQPTYEDANLILRLYELRREEKLREARKWFGGAPRFTSRAQWLEFCPSGTQVNAYFRMVTSYWEMASSFVANNILNRELFFRANNQELLFVWIKVQDIVGEMRVAQKNPLYWSSLEDVAKSFIAWLAENAPGSYEQFTENVTKSGQNAKPPAKSDA